MRALAASADTALLPAMETLVQHLLQPLVQLDRLDQLAKRALNGDTEAMRQIVAVAAYIAGTRHGVAGLYRRMVTAERAAEASDSCPCRDTNKDFASSRIDALNAEDVLDETGLVQLVLSVTSAGAGTGASASRFDRDAALDGIACLMIEAGPAVRLSHAYRTRGLDGLLLEMRSLGAEGELTRLLQGAVLPDAPMHTLSAGLNIPLPGEDLPGWPPGLKPFEDILGKLRSPKIWDRDYWQPFTPFERVALEYYSPGWRRLTECLREVGRRIDARLAIKPPPRPNRLLWSDNITAVEQQGSCAGDRIVIRGTGFEAIRNSAVLLLPVGQGCAPAAVPAQDWTDTAITVMLPVGILSGPIGFMDAAYLAAYNAWVAEQNRLADEIRQFYCYLLAKPLVIAQRFSECPPDRAVNRLRAGAAVIDAFNVNGQSAVYVEPGTSLTLAWTVRNAEKITLERWGNSGPGFNGGYELENPAGQTFYLGQINVYSAIDITYQLSAEGPCGRVQAVVHVYVRRVPALKITGIEVTQGIQRFREPGVADNSLRLAAMKDTIVRVYVSAEKLNGFKPSIYGEEVEISGELQVDGILLQPVKTARARPDSAIERWNTEHTLNFKIPAAMAQGTKQIRVRAWTKNEIEAPPDGEKVRPKALPVFHSVQWFDRRPFKIRYVRVSQAGWPAIEDEAAKRAAIRAFDLLPTPPTDIGPARVPLWHTGQDLNTENGVETLLGHIDDQHDCTFSEWLFLWEEDCPDDDGAVWVAIVNGPLWGGKAQGFDFFTVSRNTVVVPAVDRITFAHELGHTCSLNHVNQGVFPEDSKTFDELPDGGAIRRGNAFDPSEVKSLSESPVTQLYDFMSYAPGRWISPTNWERLFNKF